MGGFEKAYMKNSEGTFYGDEINFTTDDGLPTITTVEISDTTATTATSGGNITNDGGFAVTVRGVCWSTSQDPTVTDSHTTDGSGTGIFTSNITGLTELTTYYVRAYATNANGTSYGNELNFTTSTPYEALYSLSTLTIDGQINASEWSSANEYNIIFTRHDGGNTIGGTLYLQHDGIWLYVGVKTNIDAGWDVYLSLRFDGNNDHVLSGNSSEPHTDINIQQQAPEAWSDHGRYDYLVGLNIYVATAPTDTQRASYSSTNVNYEFKIKLSDLNTSAGQIIGFYIFNYNHGSVEQSYEFPINSMQTIPSEWEHIKLK